MTSEGKHLLSQQMWNKDKGNKTKYNIPQNTYRKKLMSLLLVASATK